MDIEEKEEMRNIIMTKENLNDYKEGIVDYCKGDTHLLIQMWKNLKEIHGNSELYEKQALRRGDYTAFLSVLTHNGVPLDMQYLDLLAKKKNEYIRTLQDGCNYISPNMFKPKLKRDEKNPQAILEFKKKGLDTFLAKKESEGFVFRRNKPTDGRTKKGLPPTISTAGEDLEYYQRALGVKSSLLKARQLFVEETEFLKLIDTKETWRDRIDKKGYVHPYFSPFGSSTMRNYPPQKGFPPLWHNTMRRAVVIPKDRVMVEVDYKSQEFAIAAILSQDEGMLEAYRSGDVYVDLAKRVGAWDSTGKTRSLFKALVLGIGYGMGINALMWHLRVRLMLRPEEMTVEHAKRYYDYYWTAYPRYRLWSENVVAKYRRYNKLQINDGTIMHGDNPNDLSVKNWPMQAMGGAIMREAQLLVPEKIKQIWSVHDALYAWSDNTDEAILVTIKALKEAMSEAWWRLLQKPSLMPKLEIKLFGNPPKFSQVHYAFLPIYQK